MGITSQQLRFVLAFVRHGNAEQAAEEAGYRDARALPKLLKDPDVRAAIEDRKSMSGQPPGGSNVIIIPPRAGRRRMGGKPPPPPAGAMPSLDGEVLEPTPRQRLDRAWIRNRLMRNVMIAMGDVPIIVTKIATVRDDQGTLTYKAQQIEVFERDPGAANTGLRQLADEMERLEALGHVPKTDPEYIEAEQEQQKPAGTPLGDEFSDILRQRMSALRTG